MFKIRVNYILLIVFVFSNQVSALDATVRASGMTGCSELDVFQKEKYYLLNDSRKESATKIRAFGRELVLPPRYVFDVARGADGENVISGDLYVRRPRSYLGCVVKSSIYGGAWYGPIDVCQNCDSDDLIKFGGKLVGNYLFNGVNIKTYTVADGDSSDKVYVTYIYDNSYFIAVMDSNPYLPEVLIGLYSEKKK